MKTTRSTSRLTTPRPPAPRPSTTSPSLPRPPIIAGEEGLCAGCGIATLSINYYDLGVTTGKMAAKILTGEADISEMPIEFTTEPVKKYNAANCEALGITAGGYTPSRRSGISMGERQTAASPYIKDGQNHGCFGGKER